MTKAKVKSETIDDNVEKKRDTKSQLEKLMKASGALIEKVEQEMKTGYRIVEFDDVNYRVYLPSIKDDELLVEYKNKVVSRCLKDSSLMLQAEVMKIMEERGIWDQSKEREETNLKERIRDVYKDIQNERVKDEPNEDRLDELKRERIAVDIRLRLLTKSKDFFMNSTVESTIENEMLKYKVVLCAKNEDGSRIFNSIEEFENHQNRAFVEYLSAAAMYFWAGIDQSLFDSALGILD